MSGFAKAKLHKKRGVAGLPHSKGHNYKYTKIMVDRMVACEATPTERWKHQVSGLVAIVSSWCAPKIAQALILSSAKALIARYSALAALSWAVSACWSDVDGGWHKFERHIVSQQREAISVPYQQSTKRSC